MLLYLLLFLASILATSHAGVTTLDDDDVVSRMRHGIGAPAFFFPYQVRLHDHGNFFCGGAIIHKRYILTAAHCLVEKKHKVNKITVTVGTNKLDFKKGTIYKSEKFILHENYTRRAVDLFKDRRKMHNDIALIRMSEDIKFNRDVKPIELVPSDYKYTVGENLLLSGWGLRSINSTSPDHLLMAIGKITNFEECKKSWRKITTVDNGMICYTGTLQESSCKGDSGGPAVNTKINRLVGIVYGSVDCGARGHPSVLTRISHYVDWIKRHTEN
ncbi:chymotrypsin-2-like [Trichogramma pretiosum]|uniref:chymotrypsin-2-like n=1 Tax=Trichogramma pretiosum TaxID=7493 RepID=UPI0006C948DF|nr:chymotrypsin-2-like [Trichogramma pretiosum]